MGGKRAIYDIRKCRIEVDICFRVRKWARTRHVYLARAKPPLQALANSDAQIFNGGEKKDKYCVFINLEMLDRRLSGVEGEKSGLCIILSLP